MYALTIGVLLAAASVVLGHPMPQWHSANGGGGSRYGNSNNRGGYGNSNNNNNYPQQQQYPSSTGYQQQSQQSYPSQQNFGYQGQQQQSSYGSRSSYQQPQQQQSYGGSSYSSGPQAQLYQGRFTGQCQADGFYYNDQYSLVFCTNGISYVQVCASGSQNMDVSRYTVGVDTYVSFCNVNLVDNGAGASSYGSSYGSSSSGSGSNYGSSSYGNTQRQTYAPIYPQQPSYVTLPTQSYGYQSQSPSTYQQSSSSY